MHTQVGYPVISATESLYVTPNTMQEEEKEDAVSDNTVIIIAIVAGTVVMIGLFVLIFCLYKRKMAMEENVANQLEKDSAEVANEKEQSHNIIMSDAVFFGESSFVDSPQKTAASPQPRRKPKNRRMRNRQVLEMR